MPGVQRWISTGPRCTARTFRLPDAPMSTVCGRLSGGASSGAPHKAQCHLPFNNFTETIPRTAHHYSNSCGVSAARTGTYPTRKPLKLNRRMTCGGRPGPSSQDEPRARRDEPHQCRACNGGFRRHRHAPRGLSSCPALRRARCVAACQRARRAERDTRRSATCCSSLSDPSPASDIYRCSKLRGPGDPSWRER